MCWPLSSSQKQIVELSCGSPWTKIFPSKTGIRSLDDPASRFPIIYYCQPFSKNIIKPIVCFLQDKKHFLHHRELSLPEIPSASLHVRPWGIASTYKTSLLRRSSCLSIPPPNSFFSKTEMEPFYGVCFLYPPKISKNLETIGNCFGQKSTTAQVMFVGLKTLRILSHGVATAWGKVL